MNEFKFPEPLWEILEPKIIEGLKQDKNADEKFIGRLVSWTEASNPSCKVKLLESLKEALPKDDGGGEAGKKRKIGEKFLEMESNNTSLLVRQP